MNDQNKTVVLEEMLWNGYRSHDVLQLETREAAIQASFESINAEKRHARHLSTRVTYDDGQKIVIEQEHGYDFYGWRAFVTTFYFDPEARVTKEFDEVTYEEVVQHHLSVPALAAEVA